MMAVAVGVLIGFTNGLIVIRAKIPSFIATLGAMMFWRGILLIISGGQTQPFRPGGVFEAVFAGTWGPIQAQFVWAVAVAAAAHIFLERHKIGNHMFAVGGNKQSAIAIGVNSNKVKMIGFVVVGAVGSRGNHQLRASELCLRRSGQRIGAAGCGRMCHRRA